MLFEPLDTEQSEYLLDVAECVIASRASDSRPVGGASGLNRTQSSFVTLTIDDALRGCIGSIEAHRNLIDDVAENAYAAAYRDPRFDAVTEQERLQLTVAVSVLSPPTSLQSESWEALQTALVPHHHGLVISARGRRATYLPSVWSQLPTPEAFIENLLSKAGLPRGLPIEDCIVESYTVETVARN